MEDLDIFTLTFDCNIVHFYISKTIFIALNSLNQNIQNKE